MSWRTVIITQSAKLDYQMGFMVVRQKENVKIHVNEIAAVIIETTAVSLTVALLSELTKRKIKVIFCDERRNPSSELIPYYGSHDTSEKIRRQIAWSNNIKEAVWTEIVAEKIRKQAQHLEKYGCSESKMLHQYLKEIEFGDATNREGHAAKVYFNALFGRDFSRTADISLNAALNYGYGILLSMINREIVSNGYITQLGLFHDNMFNPFNLGSDLMEPFRPVIDRIVKVLNPEKFEHEEKIAVLEFLQEEVIIAGRRELMQNAIKIYCKSIFDALNECDPALIQFYLYEL